MKKLLLTIITCTSLSVSLYAQTYSSPESVEFDSAHNRYLISNTSSSQILARSASGVLSLFTNVSGSAAYGLEIVGDTLYGCCGGNIQAYNLNTGAFIYTATMGGTFFNGITHDPAGNLYITDFNDLKIYRLNTLTRHFNVYISNTISTPNGIIYDSYDGVNPRLVFCNWNANAPIKTINLADSSVTTYNTTLTSCDGICKGRNGQFYVTNWGANTIVQYDSTFSTSAITVVTGLYHPADIFYNFSNDTLAIPDAGTSGTNANTLKFHWFGSATGLTQNTNAHFIVSPNPASDYIVINNSFSEAVSIDLVNELGQAINILNRSIINKNQFIDLKQYHLSNGIYMIKCYNEKEVLSVDKLIITN